MPYKEEHSEAGAGPRPALAPGRQGWNVPTPSTLGGAQGAVRRGRAPAPRDWESRQLAVPRVPGVGLGLAGGAGQTPLTPT